MAASPYAISGGLSGGSPGALSAFCTYYKNAICSYNQTMQGYQSLANAQYAAEQPIEAGYSNLYNTVMGTICGIQTSQLQAVQCQYTKANASTQQQMINAGLGNSTVLASLQRGNCAQKSLATTQVQNQFAQLKAGYESQLGLAGLNAQMQMLGMNTALGVQQLKCMMVPLPNPSGFASQWQMMGSKGGMPTGPMGSVPRQGPGTPARGNNPAYCNPYAGGSNMFTNFSGGCNPYSGGYTSSGGCFGSSSGGCWGGYTSPSGGDF